MEPEEIDKIFKDRLSGMPVMPAADAWMRLQQKMEPPKKERTMWIYYAAASVLIILVSGLLLFRQYNQETGVIVAQNKVKEPGKNIKQNYLATQATPGTPDASISETETIALVDKEGQEAAPKFSGDVKKETLLNKKEVQLARAQPDKNIKRVVKTKPEVLEPKVMETDNAAILAYKNKPTVKQEAKTEAFTANAPETASVVQVLVKRDNADEKADIEPEEVDLRENLSRKGILLKNLYKQARNLKNGEQVELAALGLNSEKISTEKENIKQKLNKVISL